MNWKNDQVVLRILFIVRMGQTERPNGQLVLRILFIVRMGEIERPNGQICSELNTNIDVASHT